MATLFALVARDPDETRDSPGLADVLGPSGAAKLYRSFIMDLCERYADLSVRRRVLLYGPRGSRKRMELLASKHWRLALAREGGTGPAVAGIIEQAFREGYQRVVVQTAPCPTVSPEAVIEAFDKLLVDDVVIGPTVEGGAYLVGMSLERPEFVLGFDWESHDVFDALVDRAEAFGLILGLVRHSYEVRDAEGLRRLSSHLRALAVAGSEMLPQRTQTLLQKLRLTD